MQVKNMNLWMPNTGNYVKTRCPQPSCHVGILPLQSSIGYVNLGSSGVWHTRNQCWVHQCFTAWLRETHLGTLKNAGINPQRWAMQNALQRMAVANGNPCSQFSQMRGTHLTRMPWRPALVACALVCSGKLMKWTSHGRGWYETCKKGSTTCRV